MKRTLAWILVSILCLSAFAGCAAKTEPTPATAPSTSTDTTAPAAAAEPAPAATTEEQPKVTMVVHWNEPLDPESHPISAMYDVFKREIEAAGVNITVELYPSGQLGDASSALAQIKDGIIHMGASIGLNQFASQYGMTDWMVTTMPFIVESDAEAVAFNDAGSKVFEDLIKRTEEELGIIFLQQTVAAPTFRIMTNSVREIRTPADLKGIKMRTMQDETMIALMEILGAIPTPISYPELYTALQTGVADGQENPAYNIALQKFYEVQKYCTITNHNGGLPSQGVFINAEFFHSLTDAQRAAFMDAFDKGSVAYAEFTAKLNENGLKEMEEGGMTIYTPTAEEMQQFRDVAFEPVKEIVKSKMEHPELLDQLIAEIEAVRASMN